jgi:hypothetical protein
MVYHDDDDDNPKVHCRIRKTLSLCLILSQLSRSDPETLLFL